MLSSECGVFSPARRFEAKLQSECKWNGLLLPMPRKENQSHAKKLGTPEKQRRKQEMGHTAHSVKQ